jgi:glycosyltransferase involved in cell wall biosynthesis
MDPDLTTVVLTYNEEANLLDCLTSLQPLECELFVVDSGSTDRTVEIAEAAGAQVVYNPFESQAQQLGWALEHLPIKGEWVLRLDADERLTPELAQELRTELSALDQDISGLYVKRRVYFMGRWIRHGGYYPTWLLRVWKRGAARVEHRLMDEHMILLRGRAAFLKHDILEDNQKGLFHWVERHNRYSTREAQALLLGTKGQEIRPSLFGSPVEKRRWLRQHVYNRLPLFVRPFLYFAYRYFFRLGFLDGKQGLVFHFLQGCWYRFQVDAFILESRLRSRVSSHTPAKEREVLSLPKRKKHR